jgi:acetyl esterase
MEIARHRLMFAKDRLPLSTAHWLFLPRNWVQKMKALVLGILAFLIALASPASSQQPNSPSRFTFKQTPQGPLELVVDYPANWKPTDARPAIVFFFGGGWMHGSIDQFARQATYLAGRGMVAIRADYRVASRQHTEPNAAVEDGRSALRWVRVHAKDLGIDPNLLAAAGGSAGGLLAACTAQCPLDAPIGEDTSVSPRPNALVLFNPVVDIVGIMESPHPEAVLRHFPALMQDATLQRLISPLWHVARADPPALLLFGALDSELGPARSYIRAMTAAGVRAELFTADGAHHGFFNHSPWYERTLYRTDEFLASLGYLKGLPAIKDP